MSLYKHQEQGIEFLRARSSAMLADEMGLGKTRQALEAAQWLFSDRRIDRVLVLAPAAVRYSWRTELEKMDAGGHNFELGVYDPKCMKFKVESLSKAIGLPVALVSYALLPQARHVDALMQWCANGEALLVCDESSFLKNRTAKQTKGALQVGTACMYRWLLTGTPIANSPLDLFGQGLVMAGGLKGPLRGFKNWYHFRARYAVLKRMKIGAQRFEQVVDYQNLDELTASFAPYVLRREKRDCLDLPEKTYEVREVILCEATWKVYCELKKDALLCLPDSDVKPEPNAAVRLLRLCQLTSGHVGATLASDPECDEMHSRDVSSEKLLWLAEEIMYGELSSQRALIVWCRWRRERERLAELLREAGMEVVEVYGGQTEKQREAALAAFGQATANRIVFLGQQRAGGYGLTLTQASVAVYCSNDFSYTGRIQSEDRCHRIGQHRAVTYLDLLAVGPKGQRTVDHHVLEALRAKKDLATLTCAAWRKILED